MANNLKEAMAAADLEAGLTLSARELVKRFPQGDREVEVLHGIDLELKEGEIVAILGPSGAGKSTLLHLLGLMEQPTAGTLKIQGEEVQRLSAKHRARLRNEYIGFLFQFHHLLPELNVLENVMLPQRIMGIPEREAAAQAAMLLDTLGLRDHLYKHPTALSGGEQQRVALARALVNEPALILADEPTGNLDRETGQSVLNLLWEEAHRRNAAALIVTHHRPARRPLDPPARRSDRVRQMTPALIARTIRRVIVLNYNKNQYIARCVMESRAG